MDAGPPGAGLFGQSNPPQQRSEYRVYAVVGQSSSSGGDEKALTGGFVELSVAAGGVVGERCDGAGVQRKPAVFAEFRVGDGQLPAGQVDIAAVEGYRLTDSHTRADQECEKGVMGRCPERRLQVRGGGEQRVDVVVAEQVRGGTPAAAGQQIGRWNLNRCGRVHRGQVPDEAADHTEPLHCTDLADGAGPGRPRHRQLTGDHDCR